MRVKKFSGKVIGADLTAAEKKAMNIEIKKEFAEYDRKNTMEIDAIVLWVAHKTLGLGPVKLKRFYDDFTAAMDELVKRYELEDSDQIWLCTRLLKEYGVDLEAWRNERG